MSTHPRTDRPARRVGLVARVALVGLGLGVAAAGCGSASRDPQAEVAEDVYPTGTTSVTPEPSREPFVPGATDRAQALCTAFPLDVARTLVPDATSQTPYTTRYGPSCAYATDASRAPDAFVTLRLLDRTAAMSHTTPLAFARQQAGYPHGVRIPGLRYGTFYDRGRIGTEVEIDWYEGGHNYALVLDGSASRAPKPSPEVMAARADAIPARLQGRGPGDWRTDGQDLPAVR